MDMALVPDDILDFFENFIERFSSQILQTALIIIN
jgi:hypothetical protein